MLCPSCSLSRGQCLHPAQVGSIFGGFKLPGQGQQQRPKEPQPQDEDWSGAQSDDWGGASSKPVPRNEKYDTKPYDDDDYRSDISPRRGQVGG